MASNAPSPLDLVVQEDNGDADLAEILEGLGSTPKVLSPKFFYKGPDGSA